MAVRYAGDYFGISLAEPEDKSSVLLGYYPELRNPAKAAEGADKNEARLVGGVQAPKTFTGFKTFEAKGGQQAAAPLFTGYKTAR
jgi:hypothetical protein